MNLQEQYKRLFKGRVGATDKKILKEAIGEWDALNLRFNHLDSSMANVPEKLLMLLPNKSKLSKIIDEINKAGDGFDAADPLLYKFDKELNLGLEKLMKKMKIDSFDIEIDDESTSITIDGPLDNKIESPLKRIGFEII